MTQFKANKIIFLDPSYSVYYQDQFFSYDSVLNRDYSLTPNIRLKKWLTGKNVSLMTADYLFDGCVSFNQGAYVSMGLLHDFSTFASKYNVKLKYFFIFEPPVVKPELYAALPMLTRYFEKVFVHNVEGDGYSLKGVDQSKLEKLFWPQPFHDVLEQFWSQADRLKKIIIINGKHAPISKNRELYSQRIEAMCALSKHNAIDLFGMGWNRLIARDSLWLPFLLNRNKIMKIYHGPVQSKYEAMSHYHFSLCFENMSMKGYMTEKLFDCLYLGTIPLYLGASDVESYIPEEAYIDCRRFNSWDDLWQFCKSLSDTEIQQIKEAGRDYLRSQGFDQFYYSLENAFSALVD